MSQFLMWNTVQRHPDRRPFDNSVLFWSHHEVSFAVQTEDSVFANVLHRKLWWWTIALLSLEVLTSVLGM